ncbi:MAG TPA: glycerophosphodiester phosphodiesterase family protein [Pirellulales bacterium]|nr:glycerophosphodiester phosphodiesterase family protein [Pirellulales bacterium]
MNYLHPMLAAAFCLPSLFLFVTLSVAADPSLPPFLQNGVTAHRGNSGAFPENTLRAFRSGIEVGADWIELDLFRTADDKLVVIHDATTQRVGNRNLMVARSDYDDLARVDVATDFRRRAGKDMTQCPPQSIPLLEDVLRLVMKQGRTRLSIQPKMDCVAEAVALVKQLGAERWVGFNDGNLEYMAEVKRLAPGIRVFWDRTGDEDIDEDIRVASEHGFESLVLHSKGVTPEKVQKIKAAEMEAGVWTVNDRSEMEKLLAMGVDRIYTDYPRRLLGLLTERRFHDVQCEGTYPHHLQGICTDEEAIYWSFTTQLVKTDLDGKRLGQVPVANHHGDLCFHEGKLYVAVNLGKFNDPQGNADSWVYVYNAADLSLVAKHETQQVFHGAGGIGVCNGHFFIVGGLPDGVQENYIYEYDGNFQFIKQHVLNSGHTLLGIQTATFGDDRWWFGCYGNPKILLTADANFAMQGRFEFDGSLGLASLPGGRLLVASGRCDKAKGCTGHVRLAMPDDKAGLKFIERPATQRSPDDK